MTEKLSKRERRTEEPEVWRVFQRRGTVQILVLLFGGSEMRPSEIDRALPHIARQVLGSRLSELVELGMLERSVFPGPPMGSTYSLTETGEALATAAWTLNRFAPPSDRISPAVEAAAASLPDSGPQTKGSVDGMKVLARRAVKQLRILENSKHLESDEVNSVRACVEMLERVDNRIPSNDQG